MTQYDLLVIGGGISGLTLAHQGRRLGLNVGLLEARTRPGGAMHSAAFGGAGHSPASGGDFWLELGAHTAYNSYGGLLEMVEELGLAGLLIPRVRVPWRFWDGTAPRSPASRLRWLELAISLPRLMTRRKEGATVKAYWGAVLGRGNYERVGAPMFNAVCSQDSADFPAGLLFKKRPRRREYPRSFAVLGGLGAIAAAIAAQPGLTLHTGMKVSSAASLKRAGAGFRVTAENGETFEARALGLAVPPDAARALVGDKWKAVAAALAPFAMEDIATVGVVARREAVSLPPVAGLVGIGGGCHSVVTRDPVPHPDFRGFAFHFNSRLDEGGRNTIIAGVLGLPPSRMEAVFTASHRLPALRLGHRERIAALDAALAGQPLLVTGNYFQGMAMEDCVQRSLAEAARLNTLL